MCARAARGANCPPPLPPTRTGAICTAAKITMPDGGSGSVFEARRVSRQIGMYVINKAGIFDAGFGEILRSPLLQWAEKTQIST